MSINYLDDLLSRKLFIEKQIEELSPDDVMNRFSMEQYVEELTQKILELKKQKETLENEFSWVKNIKVDDFFSGLKGITRDKFTCQQTEENAVRLVSIISSSVFTTRTMNKVNKVFALVNEEPILDYMDNNNFILEPRISLRSKDHISSIQEGCNIIQ